MEIATCKALGCNIVIKIVRGAYMNEERKRALDLAYESPIWNTIEDTHTSYNFAANEILKSLSGPNDKLFLASHNEDTVNMVLQKVKENPKFKDCVKFG